MELVRQHEVEREGQKAFRQGQPVTANPYRGSVWHHGKPRAWWNGWMRAAATKRIFRAKKKVKAMSWALGYDSHWERDIGYGVPAVCDHPRCNEIIDRGLSYVCGDEPYGGEAGCGLYFCSAHRTRWRMGHSVCTKCVHCKPPYKPKPDVLHWVMWKLETWSNLLDSDKAKLQARVDAATPKEVKEARRVINAEYA